MLGSVWDTKFTYIGGLLQDGKNIECIMTCLFIYVLTYLIVRMKYSYYIDSLSKHYLKSEYNLKFNSKSLQFLQKQRILSQNSNKMVYTVKTFAFFCKFTFLFSSAIFFTESVKTLDESFHFIFLQKKKK